MNGARYAYLSRICKLVDDGKDIVIVSDDYAAPVLDKFRVNYPERYLSVGIAEQNLIAVSCGLALDGKYAVAYGCAPFPVTRAFDQIKSAAAMMNTPVSIVSAGIGFAIPEWGATHFNVDDISIMRTLPNMRIITPTDNVMGEQVADFALTAKQPLYIRFDKQSEGEIYKGKDIDFAKGFEVLRDGRDIAIVTCGLFTLKTLNLAEQWNGIDAKIIDLYSLPYDETKLLEAIGDLPVITLEEHVLQGGIGSALLETLNEHNVQKKITRMGINWGGEYPHLSGSREYFLRLYGLSDDDITKTVVTESRNKK